MRVLLIVNSLSRQGKVRSDQALAALKEAGFEVIYDENLKPPQYCAEIRRRAKEVDGVILAGGDGTVHCSLPGLVDSGLPLGLFPLGTANNLARNLGLPSDMKEVCEMIKHRRTRRIDVGVANERHFINVAGIGLSTQVNRHVPGEMKKRWGPLAYVYYAFVVARRMRPFRLEVVDGSGVQVTRAMQVTVCNGRYYGTGITIAPEAEIDDEQLDLMSVEVKSWWHGLRLVPAFLRDRAWQRDEVRMLRGREFELRTRRRMHVDLDGEINERTPVRFRVLPKALTVFTPVNP